MTTPIKINVRKKAEFLDSDDDLTPVLYISPEDSYRIENNKNRIPTICSPTDLQMGYRHFSRERLEKCTLPQLITLCRMYKLSVIGDEEDLIDRILAYPITSKHSI